MKLHDVAQGTREWLNLRAGIPTASQFDLILTPGGKPSASAERYMFMLLAERCMGHPVAEHVSLWMKRGSELEADAVRFYELQKDCDTVPCGFITNDAGTVGASPDRLVGEDGLLETKVPNESTHMSYLLQAAGAYKAYRPQVQGQLWVTGRKWEDVLSFHPELPPALIRVERDEGYIETLATEVTAFSTKLEALSEEIERKGWITLETAPRGVSTRDLIQAMRDSLVSLQR